MKKIINKVIVSATIGVGAALLGTGLVITSPLLFAYMITRKPRPPIDPKQVDEWMKGIQKIADPDGGQRWKQDHQDIYGEP